MSGFLKKFIHINTILQKEASQVFYLRGELTKFFWNLSTNILKEKFEIDNQERFLKLFMILQPHFFEEKSVGSFLLNEEDQFNYFIKYYGKSISLNQINKDTAIKIPVE